MLGPNKGDLLDVTLVYDEGLKKVSQDRHVPSNPSLLDVQMRKRRRTMLRLMMMKWTTTLTMVRKNKEKGKTVCITWL